MGNSWLRTSYPSSDKIMYRNTQKMPCFIRRKKPMCPLRDTNGRFMKDNSRKNLLRQIPRAVAAEQKDRKVNRALSKLKTGGRHGVARNVSRVTASAATGTKRGKSQKGYLKQFSHA